MNSTQAQPPELPENKLWTIHNLAAYMQVKSKTAYGIKDEPGFPRSIKVGKSLRWVPAEVKRHFEHNRGVA